MKSKEKIKKLVDKYHNGTITDDEVDKLFLLVKKEEIKEFDKFYDDFTQQFIEDNL